MSTMGDRLRVKLIVKTAIEHHLYGRFDDKMKLRLHELIDRNNAMTMHASESFSFKGVRYIKEGWRVHPTHIKRLHSTLDAAMEEWLQERAAINDYERPLVMGYVQTVLNTSAKPADYLVLFPTALTEPFKEQLAELRGDHGHVSVDAAETLVVQHETAYTLLKIRLMANLLGVD